MSSNFRSESQNDNICRLSFSLNYLHLSCEKIASPLNFKPHLGFYDLVVKGCTYQLDMYIIEFNTFLSNLRAVACLKFKDCKAFFSLIERTGNVRL